MKTLIFLVLAMFASVSYADCSSQTSESSSESKEVSTVEMPKGLKGKHLLIVDENNKVVGVFKPEEYMIAKRLKTTKVVSKNSDTVRTCSSSAPEQKNEVMIGARRDYTGLDKRSSGSSATVESKKDIVLDATYMRRRVLDSKLNMGVGLDTNGTPRGVVGIDF